LIFALTLFVCTVAAGSDFDAAGKAYETAPWDATFGVDLGEAADAPRQASFTIRVHPEWAPEGAKRFQDIVRLGLLKEARFFRVVPDFMAQFGIPGEPQVAKEWDLKTISDDPVKQSNKRGMVTFATAGPNTRTTQMFINYVDNSFLDSQGFSPFAEVVENGMEVVDRIQNKYGEEPDQDKITNEGNEYLKSDFPDLSFVQSLAAVSSRQDAPAVLAENQAAVGTTLDQSVSRKRIFRQSSSGPEA